MKKFSWIVVLISIAVYGCMPTSAPAKVVTVVTSTNTAVAKYTPTVVPTATFVFPTGRIIEADQLPVKNWPDLEQYYVCNDAERNADRWYGVDPLVESPGEQTVSKNTFEWVIEVRSDNYTVEVPNGAFITKINFTTKSCDVDWLYVILPRDRDPLDFKITVRMK